MLSQTSTSFLEACVTCQLASVILRQCIEPSSFYHATLHKRFIWSVRCMLADGKPRSYQLTVSRIFERIRIIGQEGQVNMRAQYLIEGLLLLRPKLREAAPVPPNLDLVEAEDQLTHNLELDDATDPQVKLDVFSVNPEYTKHESEYEVHAIALGLKALVMCVFSS